MAVHDERDRVAADRLLEAARSEKRIDLERLAFDRPLNRRVVQERHELRRAKTRESRLELQRLVDRLAHELLDDRLAPRAKRTLAEPAAESLRAGDPNSLQLAGIAVEHDDAGVGQDLAHLRLFSRLDVVVAEHRGNGNSQGGQLAGKNPRF